MRQYRVNMTISTSDAMTEERLEEWIQHDLGPAVRVVDVRLEGRTIEEPTGPMETCEGCGKERVLASHLRRGAALPVRLCSACHDVSHVLDEAGVRIGG
jgi:hypothetical protein